MHKNFFDYEVNNGNPRGFTDSKPFSAVDAGLRSQRIYLLLRNIDEKRNKQLQVFHAVLYLSKMC